MTYEEKVAYLEAMRAEVAGRPHVLGSWELQASGLDRAEEAEEANGIDAAKVAPEDLPAFLVSEEERKRLFPDGGYVSKGSVTGRSGMPAKFVSRMYAYYCAGHSLEQTGRRFGGRTRQSVYDAFHRRGFALRSELQPAKRRKVELSRDGFDYSPGKHGYLRATSGDRHLLHVRLWEKAHGPVPLNHQIFFRDGNNRNFAIENLGCESVLDGLARVRPAGFEIYLALGRGEGRRIAA